MPKFQAWITSHPLFNGQALVTSREQVEQLRKNDPQYTFTALVPEPRLREIAKRWHGRIRELRAEHPITQDAVTRDLRQCTAELEDLLNSLYPTFEEPKGNA
jgi:hypothetical protein